MTEEEEAEEIANGAAEIKDAVAEFRSKWMSFGGAALVPNEMLQGAKREFDKLQEQREEIDMEYKNCFVRINSYEEEVTTVVARSKDMITSFDLVNVNSKSLKEIIYSCNLVLDGRIMETIDTPQYRAYKAMRADYLNAALGMGGANYQALSRMEKEFPDLLDAYNKHDRDKE